MYGIRVFSCCLNRPEEVQSKELEISSSNVAGGSEDAAAARTPRQRMRAAEEEEEEEEEEEGSEHTKATLAAAIGIAMQRKSKFPLTKHWQQLQPFD